MPVQGMTPEEILLATAEQVASGAKSTDRANRLPGETATEANARITQAYKDLLAKPILTPELEAINAEVKFVRQGAGGVGEYVVVTPIGAKIPANDATEWSVGIIPSNSKYVTGTTLGTFSLGNGQVTNVGEVPVTTITKAGETSTRAFEGQDAYYTVKVGNTGKTQAQIDAEAGQAEALQFNKDIATLLGGTVDATTGKVTNVAGKTVTSVVPNANGTTTITSSDGTKTTVQTPASAPAPSVPATPSGPVNPPAAPAASTPSVPATPAAPKTPAPGTSSSAFVAGGLNIPAGVTVTTTYVDPKTGDTVGVLSDGTTKVLSAGDKLRTERVSTMNTLIERFNKYGLASLANKIKELAIDGATESTITLQLQETPEYQQRFSANAARIKQGLQVLNPAEYLSLEDGYRQVLRAYGLKAFDTDSYVQQFIANDVSAAELSNRVVTAVQRVQNADPAIQRQLRDYYGIGTTDLVAYVLDPQQQFQKIERQVAAAEIGVAAGRQGLKPGVAVAEQLASQGITQAEAQKGYATIADILPTAEKLSEIYGNTLDTYGQSEAEQEVFNSLASAQRKREKLVAREQAAFSGMSGTNRTSLTTSTVGQF